MDCILVTPDKGGYKKVWRDGRAVYLHRLAYERTYGAIPTDREVDHACKHTNCINSGHLNAVTHQENCQRANHVGGRTSGRRLLPGRNASLTHCPQGHPYVGANLYTYPNGRRRCRECNRRALRRFREKAVA